MVKISALVEEKAKNGEHFVSFEYFPPRTQQGVENLNARIERMAKTHDPLYVDFTWGAGGTTADLTLELTKTAKDKMGLVANMHLTCTNMDAALITRALDEAKEAGIDNILALRGDPPAGQDAWAAVDGGFNCALDLVRYIKKMYGNDFCVSVTGYPEGHPNMIKPVEEGRTLSATEELRKVVNEDGVFVCSDEDYEKEMGYLKEKVDAGAELIITQMFFDVDTFLAFVRDCRERGILCPILPGLMCIQAYQGFKKMTAFCKSRVPQYIVDELEKVKDNDKLVKAFGIRFGIEICNRLLESGLVGGIHFYTLNLENVTNGIIEGLNLKRSKSDAAPEEEEVMELAA